MSLTIHDTFIFNKLFYFSIRIIYQRLQREQVIQKNTFDISCLTDNLNAINILIRVKLP